MPVATPAPSITVQGNVEGSIVVGDHNFVVHTNYGTIVNRQAPPRVKLRDVAPAPPRLPRGLVGRANELAGLEQRIAGRDAVVVSGIDGLGKTSLVKQAANGTAARACPNGVVYLEGVDAQGVELGLEDVTQCLFDALYESDPPLKVNAASARTYLSNTTPLVVLDNLRLSPPGLVSLFELFPQGAVLVTSPQPSTDATIESVKLAPLARAEAVQLFASRAGRVLDDGNRGVVDTLCAALADVPLAIVTAAKAISQSSLPLERALEIVARTRPASADPQQAGIERSRALAFATLTPAERAMWSVVAAAPGVSVDRAWVEQVAGGQSVSGKLERLGLVQANSPRLRVPPGLRADGPPGEDVTTAREQLLDYIRGSLASRSLDFNLIADELGNILGLHEWVFAQRRWPDVIAIGRAIDPYLALRGLWEAWQKVLDRTLQAAQASGNRAVEAWALHELGTRAIGTGARDLAARHLRQALALRQALGDLTGAAYTQHNLNVLFPPPPPSPPDKPNPPPKPMPVAAGTGVGWTWGIVAFVVTGVIVLAGILGAVFVLPALFPTPGPTLWAPDVDFVADRTSLNVGECTTLRWNLRRGDWVELDSQRRDRAGQESVCPGQTTTYTLVVGGGVGTRRDISIVVAGTPTLSTPTATATPTSSPTTTGTLTPVPTATSTATRTSTPTPTPTPTIVSTIPIGRDVWSVALDPFKPFAYVTDRSGGISVVNLSTRQVSTWFQIAKDPLSGIAVHPKGDPLYVSSDGGFVYMVSAATGKVVRSMDLNPGVRVSNERPLVLTRDGAWLFVADSFYQSNTVFMLDAGTLKYFSATSGYGPGQPDVDANGNTLMVPNFNDDTVTQFFLGAGSMKPGRTFSKIGGPTSVQLSGDGRRAFITTGIGTPGQIGKLDVGSGQVSWLPLPTGQYVAALSPDETRLVAASNTQNQVFIIDVPNWRLLRTVPVKAWSIAISSDSQTAYAPDPTVKGLSIFGIR